MPIVDRRTRSIDLSSTGEALDAEVLGKLRTVLHLNDFFIHLSLSHNALSDECVAMLCGILKDKTYLETVQLRDCQLSDKDCSLYLVPAILARDKVKSLDLSKNSHLTDNSTNAICRLIRESGIVDLRLGGTSLTRSAGRAIAHALEGNTTMEVCELPFTVGYDVLDRVSFLLSRNAQYRTCIKDASSTRAAMEGVLVGASEAHKAVSLPATPSPYVPGPVLAMASDVAATDERAAVAAALPGMGRTQRERVALARYCTTGGRKNAMRAQQSPLPGLACSRSPIPSHSPHISLRNPSHEDGGETGRGTAGSSFLPPMRSGPRGSSPPVPASSPAYACLRDFGSLHEETFLSATDRAVNRSLHHLRVLDSRCRAVDQYRHARRVEHQRRCGLADSTPRGHTTNSITSQNTHT